MHYKESQQIPKQQSHAKHGGHKLALGLEFGAWIPIGIAVFLTVGAMAVYALVVTGMSSRQLALASPYDCWFAANGQVGCNGSSCAECVNGSAISLSAGFCSGLSCGPTAPTATPVPTTQPNNTPTPGSGAPSVTPIPTSKPNNTPTPFVSLSAGGGGGSTTVIPTATKTPTNRANTVNPTVTPAKAFSFGNLPVEAALKLFAGKAIGEQCELNKECESKHCVPNEYGSYCGASESVCQPGALRCGIRTGANASQLCNVNGFWQLKEICQGGCQQGACIPTVCTPNQAVCDLNVRKICASDGMSWRSENCNSNTTCRDGACVLDSIPACSNMSSCSSNGSYCTNSSQQKFVCVDGSWKKLFNGQSVNVVGCPQQKAGLYLAGLNDATELIAGIKNFVIDCSTQASIFNLSTATAANVCQLDPSSQSSFVRLLCNSSASVSSIAHSSRHEAAKVWAIQRGFSGAVVPAYSETVGCRRQNTTVGVHYVFNNEQPVSSLGRKDCAEAFAEAVAMYLEEPCRMKEVFPIQYRWMSSSESPFKGEQRCAK